jgi:hypothetical protein
MRSGFLHGLSSGEISRSFCPLDPLAPALARTGPAFAPGWLETLSDCLRLLEVFGRGAPKEQASGHFSNRQRYPEFCGHAEEAVFHRGGAGPLRKREARRRVVQELDLLPKGIIECRMHPGAAAHSAGFC